MPSVRGFPVAGTRCGARLRRNRAAPRRTASWTIGRALRLCDVVNLILSGVLFFSPWLFDLSSARNGRPPRLSASSSRCCRLPRSPHFAVWEEWFILVAGLALIVSPWLLGFQNSDAMSIDVVIGVDRGGAGGVRGLADTRPRAVDHREPLKRTAAEDERYFQIKRGTYVPFSAGYEAGLCKGCAAA